MKGSKKKRRSKEKKAQKKKKKNGIDPLHPLQISSGPQETSLKWDKLSPSEFETLQEYIQCKWSFSQSVSPGRPNEAAINLSTGDN